MAGPNTSGTPDTSDIVLGRGILYFAELDANGFPGAWRDLGYSREFTVTVDSETLEYIGLRTGLGVKVKEVTTQQSISASFGLDEVNDENLSLFFAGSKSSYTNPTVAGFTNSALTTSLELGRWYDLKTSANVRAYDVEGTNLTVNRDPGGTPVALTEGAAGTGDYIVDTERGAIFFHETPNTGTLVAGDTIEVVLAADAGAAATINNVSAQTVTSKVGALKFVGENAADGEKTEFQLQKTTIRADGDFALLGEDWQSMTFSASAEQNTAYPTADQYMTIRGLPSA